MCACDVSILLCFILFIFSAKVCEIKDLQNLLEDVKHRNKTFEDSLIVAKVQITQLEEQLFAVTSLKSNVIM